MKITDEDVAIVTGGGSGIGSAVGLALAERGAHVVLVDVEQSALDEIVHDIDARGYQVEGFQLDVRDHHAFQEMASDVFRKHGRIDILINNAGVVTTRRPIWEQSEADLRWTTEVNFYGVVHGIQAVVPYLVAAKRGHVVTISSLAGLSPIPGGGNGIYSATKHAVVGLSETLRVELDEAAPNVGVTLVFPGPVPTRIKDAGRNRPPEFADDRPEPSAKPEFGLVMESVPADVLALKVLAAIDNDEAYLCSASDVAERGLQRLAAIERSLRSQT